MRVCVNACVMADAPDKFGVATNFWIELLKVLTTGASRTQAFDADADADANLPSHPTLLNSRAFRSPETPPPALCARRL